MKAQVFEFTSYSFDAAKGELILTYTITFEDGDPVVFTETVTFPTIKTPDENGETLRERVFESVHLMLGISYYKTYLPPRVELPYKLNRDQAAFWSRLYKNGLGEFLYRNYLDPEIVAEFPSYDIPAEPFEVSSKSDSVLVGIGGGKDSVVVTELLKESGYKPSTFFVQYQKRSPAAVDDVVAITGLDHLRIIRVLDPKLGGNMPGSYNGHIPASGIFAFLGLAAAVLYGHGYVVVGNEYSSNFGNLVYKGMTVNHQWSKSQEFETMFADYIRQYITPDVKYFSLLRPFYEYRIVEMFVKYEKYFASFTSCNRNFVTDPEKGMNKWCGKCPKCAFMFLMLAAHLPKEKVLGIFGKNMFDDEKLIPVFKDVLGLGTMKPFDCVGTFDEAAAAVLPAAPRWQDTSVIKSLTPVVHISGENLSEISRTHPSKTIPAQFAFAGMKKVLILGYGVEGAVTKEFLTKTMPEMKIGIADKTESDAYLEQQNDYDIAVKTPGIPKEKVTIQYTTATNIFFSKVYKNMTIGVTGTKGKSTTASIIYAILKEAGRDVRLVGNIGAPMLGALTETYDDNTVFVIELSSFQLDDAQYSPRIAVHLNLFPEHMDYHGSVESYYAAKDAIFRYQRPSDILVYNAASAFVSKRIINAPSRKIPFADPLPFEDKDIPLLGEHNKDNVRAAVAAARQLDIGDDVIRRAVTAFKSLPHRLEFIGEADGIRFYDDAISTTPESAIAALRALPGTETIFLGGEDRGYDFAALEQVILKSNVKNVVLFPDSGKRMFVRRPDSIKFLETSRMEEAVDFAFKYTEKGSVCLLSTASPSYSLWKNFEEKGNEFRKWVLKGPHHAS